MGGARGLSAPTTTTRWVYPFQDGSADMRELLGNKGANLAEMTRVLGPEKVPGGFTVTTAACVEYMRNGGEVPAGLDDQIAGAVSELEHAGGKQFGDPDGPLFGDGRGIGHHTAGRAGVVGFGCAGEAKAEGKRRSASRPR